MNDYHRPNNIVVPITHVPIKQVEDNVHNNCESHIMNKKQEVFIKSRFINYEVMIPISASTEEISTKDQDSACSNSKENQNEKIPANDISESDVDLSFLDEIDVDLIITYLKEVALDEKLKSKDTQYENHLEDSITKNEKISSSRRKKVNSNLDIKNKKLSTKKEPKYLPPSKTKNLKTNDTRSKTTYTKENINTLLKQMREQYEADANGSKIQLSKVSQQPEVMNRRKTSTSSEISCKKIKDMEKRRESYKNVNKISKCEKLLEIKNKQLKTKESFAETRNSHLQYDSVIRTSLSTSQSSKSSKYREIKHERVVKIISEKSKNKESNLPRNSNSYYANANSSPNSSRGKVLKAKEKIKYYTKLKEKYGGLQVKSNTQRKCYSTDVENVKRTCNMDKNYKKHEAFNDATKQIVTNVKDSTKYREDCRKQSVCNIKLIESKLDKLATPNTSLTITDITFNDSYKISGNELTEILGKITPKQKLFDGSNQQVQLKQRTNVSKKETFSEENVIEAYTPKQVSPTNTPETLAFTHMTTTKSTNDNKDRDDKTKNIVSSVNKQNSTEQRVNELRKKFQQFQASLYSSEKPSNENKNDNILQNLIEKPNNENINAIKNQVNTLHDQNMNNKSTNNQVKQPNANNQTENTKRVIEESISSTSIHGTNTKLSNIKTSNENNTQTLVEKTNKKQRNKDNVIIIDDNSMQKVHIKLIDESQKLVNKKSVKEKNEDNVIIIDDDAMEKVYIKPINESQNFIKKNIKHKNEDNIIIIEDDEMQDVDIKCIEKSQPLVNKSNMKQKSDDNFIKCNNKRFKKNTLQNEQPKIEEQKVESLESTQKPNANGTNMKPNNIDNNEMLLKKNNMNIIANERTQTSLNEKAKYMQQKEESHHLVPTQRLNTKLSKENSNKKQKNDYIKSIKQDNYVHMIKKSDENMMPNEKDILLSEMLKGEMSVFTSGTDNEYETLAIDKETEKLFSKSKINSNDEIANKTKLQDLRNKMEIKQVNSGNRLGKCTKVENKNNNSAESSFHKTNPISSDIQSNIQEDNNNVQTVNQANIKPISIENVKKKEPNLQNQSKEIKLTFAENVDLEDKTKEFVKQSNIKLGNENLSNKHINDNAKIRIVNSSSIKPSNALSICINQPNVEPNTENKIVINQQKIGNSNAKQQNIKVEKKVVKQCSKGKNNNSTYEINESLASKKNTTSSNTSSIDDHKCQMNINEETVNKNSIELDNHKMEKSQDKDIDCKDEIHKNVPNFAKKYTKSIDMKSDKNKQTNAKPNNVTQGANNIIEQNTELNINKEEKSTKNILKVDKSKSETKTQNNSIRDKVNTNVTQRSNSISARSNIETSNIQHNNCKSNNQQSINEIKPKKDLKESNEVESSKKQINKTNSIRAPPYNPLKQNIVSAYFRIAHKLNKNKMAYKSIAQDAMELNISVHMGIYCKVSVIHDGSWSRIHKLHINNTRDYMVLKQMRPKFNGHPNKGYEKECLLKNLQSSCTLQEMTNLLKVYNGFQFNGTWCHVMDYYPLNLTEGLWSDCKGGLNICQIIHLSKQLIGAVKTLKKYKIIHSDIQPDHILMNNSLSTLKLCGFDNAHYVDDSKQSRYLGGIKSYRAPEIILQTSGSYSVDAWAAACILFEITTKRPLFKCTFDTFGQQMSLLFNWDQESDTDFDKLCKLHIEQCRNYKFQGPQSPVPQKKIASYMIEGYRQVHTYKIPPKDVDILKKFSNIVAKMLVLNQNKRLPIESVFFKILDIT